MTNKVKPITPAEARQKQVDQIPDFVFEAFNELIARGIGSSNSVRFKQDDVVNLVLTKAPEGTTYQTLLDNKWLDVERAYRKAGWKVTYDGPGYNESYSATFTFAVNSKS